MKKIYYIVAKIWSLANSCEIFVCHKFRTCGGSELKEQQLVWFSGGSRSFLVSEHFYSFIIQQLVGLHYICCRQLEVLCIERKKRYNVSVGGATINLNDVELVQTFSSLVKESSFSYMSVRPVSLFFGRSVACVLFSVSTAWMVCICFSFSIDYYLSQPSQPRWFSRSSKSLSSSSNDENTTWVVREETREPGIWEGKPKGTVASLDMHVQFLSWCQDKRKKRKNREAMQWKISGRLMLLIRNNDSRSHNTSTRTIHPKEIMKWKDDRKRFLILIQIKT